MENIFLVIVFTFIVAVIFMFITYFILRKNRVKKYKEKIEELDISKNKLIGVDILTEITKVRELVKTENLQHKLDSWNNTFDYIKDNMLPKITDDISELDFMVDKHDYNNALRKITNIELEIARLKKKSDKLIEEMGIITNSEERNRALITKLKVEYREQLSHFHHNEKEYGDLVEIIEKRFKEIDDSFLDFESAIEDNDYVLVEEIVISIEEKINFLKRILNETPELLLSANAIISKKIDEVILMNNRMERDGYPIKYLKIEYNLEEIKKKRDTILTKLKKLELDDINIELKTILDYFDTLFKNFDKERECKDLFKEGVKKFRNKLEKVNKIVYDIYKQIDDIKITYELTDAEISKFSNLNKNLETINISFKELLDNHKEKETEYSKLYDDLEALVLKLSRLQDDLDYQLKSITSMQDDEYRAHEQLETIKKLLKEAKIKIDKHKLPVIPNSYFIELREAEDAIKEIALELEKKPIVIKILNIRVDTARDLVFKIHNKTNELIRLSGLSERMIMYGNRYRSSNKMVDESLTQAELLFYKGQYENSLKMAIGAVKIIEQVNPLDKMK